MTTVMKPCKSTFNTYKAMIEGYQKMTYIPEYNADGTEKHVVCEGARFHVLSWNTKDGAICSEPNCEVNKK